MPIPAGIALAAPIVGNLLGGLFSNNASAKQADRQMKFQKMMSDTAHQREVADLRAAGLNPMLSVNAGASSPGGAMGQTSDMGSIGTDAASSAIQTKRLQLEQGLMEAEVGLKSEQAGLANANRRAVLATLPQKQVIGDAVSSGRNALEWARDQVQDVDRKLRDREEQRQTDIRVKRMNKAFSDARQRRALQAGSARMEARRQAAESRRINRPGRKVMFPQGGTR